MMRILMFTALLCSVVKHGHAFNSEANDVPNPPQLSLDTVLDSSLNHYPLILESIAKQKQASAKQLTSLGAFDKIASADGFARVSGFWDGRVIDGKISKRLDNYGATLFGGYKLSDGRFPIYEDINFTDSLGAIKAGAVVSLMKGREIDPQRFARKDANLGVEQADFELLNTQVKVQFSAILAYQDWVAAGQRFQVYQGLLDIALERDKALQSRVKAGDQPKILLVENQQNILRRQALLVETERDLQLAANRLMLYWRNNQGEPIMPIAAQLPPQLPFIGEQSFAVDEKVLQRATNIRPEISLNRIQMARAENRLSLARNELLPQLDVGLEYQLDMGRVAEGGSSRQGNDTILSLKFSVPLERRAARGKVSEADAQIFELQKQEQRLKEQITTEILDIAANISAARELVQLADTEADLAFQMRQAEEKRFEGGDSNFFLLNRREEATAQAQVRQVQANLRLHNEVAHYHAASADLEKLGIFTD